MKSVADVRLTSFLFSTNLLFLQHLSSELIKNLDGQLKVVVSRHAAEYEHRLQVRQDP
jgi:hypothetical protein